jgi:hypothetical protein
MGRESERAARGGSNFRGKNSLRGGTGREGFEIFRRSWPRRRGRNRVAVRAFWRAVPRVGLIAFGQPWAGGRKPFGLIGSGERQRCFVLQPGVARLALPREGVPIGFNPKGVAAKAEGAEPRWGSCVLGGGSQGRPHCIRPTLGWRAKALWAYWIRGTPTVFRPPARGCATRATSGKVVRLVSTPTGLRPGRRGGGTPLGFVRFGRPIPG